MITAGMDVNSKNMATVSVTCDSDIFDTNKITAKCELQQLNGSWKTIKTWTETNNDSAIMYTKSYAIAKNYSYRLKVTAYVYKDTKLLDGHCSLSNNLAENSIRWFTVGKKNWLFSGSPKGAQASAGVYTLIETAKANGLNPRKYIKHILGDIPGTTFRHYPELLDDYLP